MNKKILKTIQIICLIIGLLSAIIAATVFYFFEYKPNVAKHRQAQEQLFEDVDYMLEEYEPYIDHYIVGDDYVKIYYNEIYISLLSKEDLEFMSKGIFCQIENLALIDEFINKGEKINVYYYDNQDNFIDLITHR